MKKTIQGWGVWLLGLLAVFVSDYSLRVMQNNMYDGGISYEIQNGFFIVIAIIAVWLFYEGVKDKGIWIKAPIIAAQIFVGFWVYAYLALYYVCKAGIDCI